MDLWYPKARRSLVFSGAGSYVHGPYRVVLHTTEGTSIDGALQTYRRTGWHPHFTVAQTVEQHLQIDRAATALCHPRNTCETNKASAIQIEIVGMAEHVQLIAGTTMSNLRDLVAWICTQVGVTLSSPPFKAYPASYGVQNGIRLSESDWRSFNGVLGHQHVPNQTHGDPGLIDLSWLKDLKAPEEDMPQPRDCVATIETQDFQGAWTMSFEGNISTEGQAPFYGCIGTLADHGRYSGPRSFYGLRPGGPHPSDGYILVRTDGAEFHFDAQWRNDNADLF